MGVVRRCGQNVALLAFSGGNTAVQVIPYQ